MRWLLVLAVLTSSARAEDLSVSRRLAHEGNGFAQATTEYNDRLHFDLAAEARVYWRLRVVAGVAIGEVARPGVGLGVELFDGAIGYLRYKAEGFSEPEGELEAMLSYGRQVQQFHLAGALAYGQDPEGNERDGELHAAAQVGITNTLFAGVSGRYRDALGSTKEPLVRDAIAGGSGSWRIGKIAVGALVGIAMSETRGEARRFGPGGTLSVGAVF